MKKVGPMKILYKFLKNAYEVEIPHDIGISPIFNVHDLFPYQGTHSSTHQNTLIDLEGEDLVQDLPTPQPFQLDIIVDYKVIKKTRKRRYKTYLVK